MPIQEKNIWESINKNSLPSLPSIVRPASFSLMLHRYFGNLKSMKAALGRDSLFLCPSMQF